MELLVLAKSDKKCNNEAAGFCVAGVTSDGRWVRLVSDKYGDAVPKSSCRSFNTEDTVTIPNQFLTQAPLDFQPENYWVHDFRLIRSSNRDIAYPKTDTDPFIFFNKRHFLYTDELRCGDKSLFLADVYDLYISRDEYKKFKATFIYNNHSYEKMSITDPFYYREQKIRHAHIVISLPPEPWRHQQSGEYLYYKFISAIYEMQ
ncbi:MAG: hypothetical protein FWG87_01960 [Defluviitaleaceae bacterium]|nr:hypothetical protein [Defluviitaleaceae bacterium]